jgi:hypothetical protein
MNLKKLYEKETGKQPRIKFTDGIHTYSVIFETYTDGYVEWLENKLSNDNSWNVDDLYKE